MADTKQVDWRRLSMDAVDKAKPQDWPATIHANWLRTTFEPLVKAAQAFDERQDFAKLCSNLRAALDRLPKVGE